MEPLHFSPDSQYYWDGTSWVARPFSSLAVIALISGLAGWCLPFMVVLGMGNVPGLSILVIGPLMAIFLGEAALREIKKYPYLRGRKCASVASGLGYWQAGLFILFLVVFTLFHYKELFVLPVF